MAGLQEIDRKLKAFLSVYNEVTVDQLDQPLREALDTLEAQSVELAPVDQGNLSSSTTVRGFKRGSREVGELAFTAHYAAEVHELPPEARGPRTRQKPGNEFGLAGPKFLERPLRGMQKTLGERIGKALVTLWRRRARIR